MDKPDTEKNSGDEGNQLIRNRSFKTKQLVRSQAIRESASPPRTVSPSVREPPPSPGASAHSPRAQAHSPRATAHSPVPNNDSSHDIDSVSHCDRRKPVSIQITGGGCESASWCRGRVRRVASDARLLSNNPRRECVCGACHACPHCRCKKRRHKCPTKQDSGIVCSDDCQDCSDTEQNGTNDTNKKSASLDVDEYCKCPERKERERPKNVTLSRTDSDDKQEPTGPELVAFIKETLNKNNRDRVTLLKIEKELYSFVNDNGRCIVKFPVMTSYGRMLVHRCAALFQLSHHLDHSNKNCVVVSKSGTSGGCIPCTGFKSWCVANLPPSPQRHHNDATNAKSILKRDAHSLDEPAGGASALIRSKSLEQREKEYEKVRRRIFSSDNCNQDESQWPWVNSGPVKLLTPDPSRNKLLKVQSLEGSGGGGGGSGGGEWGARGQVAKSHSFGGYVPHRHISKQGDLASSSWRLSPSSSGYKTLSLRSTDSVTPSPTGGGTPEPGVGGGVGGVMWAVTDMAGVPRGALLIHPHTGRPLTNPDGSLYHFDPANPPAIYDAAYTDEHNKIDDQNNEKRRGRLEKQHSFIDNDSECQQQTEECRNDVYCDCGKHEHQKAQEKESPKQTTPVKKCNEPPEAELTNQNQATVTPNQNAANEVQQPISAVDPNIANRKQYENQIQMKHYEAANQNSAKVSNNEHVVYGQQYVPTYNEEVASPPQMQQYIQDMTNLQNQMQQAKLTSVQMADNNIRPLSIPNVLYPPSVMMPAGYPYIHNQIRTDQLQQMYQPMVHQQVEEQKAMTSQQPQQDTSFRIDPSYPYPPLEYAACACADTTQQQRSFSVPYNQLEMAQVQSGVVPPYPIQNVMVPHPMPTYPVQYQEAVPWQPVAMPHKMYDVCPVIYPPPYAQYNILYPQVVPQPYPSYPVYPVIDKQDRTLRKRTSLPPSTRNTPNATPDEKKQDDKDINAKICQIKEQMAQMNVRGRERNGEWRNNGSGLLGNYPVGVNGRVNGNQSSEETQLSSAARAIVNSIRNMQAKNTYHDKRLEGGGRGAAPPRQDHYPPYLLRQMSPGAWVRRSPAPVHQGMNHPRRQHPDSRNARR